MKMKKLYLMIFVAGMMTSCTPEPEGPAPEDLFVKYYGQAGLHTATDIVATSRGEYIILASQDLGDTTGTNFYLIKANSSGTQIREVSLNFNNNDDVPTRIKPVGDSEFLIIGTSTTPNGQNKSLIYARINDSLNIVSNNQTFYEISAAEVSSAGADQVVNLEGSDIIPVMGANGAVDYVVLGTAELENGRTKIFVSRRNTQKGRVWLSDKYIGSENRALAIFERPDQRLLIVGSTDLVEGNFSGTNVAVYLINEVATSAENTVITGFNSAGAAAHDIPYDVIEKSSDSYMIVGSTSLTDGTMTSFQLEVTGSGHKKDQHVVQKFKGSDQPMANQAFSITRTHSNEFIVVGKYQSISIANENKLSEMMVIRTSQAGEHITEADQHYGLASGDDEANAVVTAPDGDVVVAATVDFGTNTRLIGLLKLNRFGELKD